MPGAGRAHSGYYARLRQGASAREQEDGRLLGLIKHHWLASGAVNGYRKIALDLRERRTLQPPSRLATDEGRGLGGTCGHGRKPRHRGGPVGVVANVLNRCLAPQSPNKVWAADIANIRSNDG